MATRAGLLIGDVAARSGVSRKALRLYEATGILPAPRRTASGYRAYEPETLAILAFVARARRLGFRLEEIREVVMVRRSGRCPCPHVLALARRKIKELDRTLADLTDVRRGLQDLLRTSSRVGRGEAAVCRHIEQLTLTKGRR
jgi:DNA-binding transcriptional MerR regulator